MRRYWEHARSLCPCIPTPLSPPARPRSAHHVPIQRGASNTATTRGNLTRRQAVHLPQPRYPASSPAARTSHARPPRILPLAAGHRAYYSARGGSCCKITKTPAHGNARVYDSRRSGGYFPRAEAEQRGDAGALCLLERRTERKRGHSSAVARAVNATRIRIQPRIFHTASKVLRWAPQLPPCSARARVEIGTTLQSPLAYTACVVLRSSSNDNLRHAREIIT